RKVGTRSVFQDGPAAVFSTTSCLTKQTVARFARDFRKEMADCSTVAVSASVLPGSSFCGSAPDSTHHQGRAWVLVWLAADPDCCRLQDCSAVAAGSVVA